MTASRNGAGGRWEDARPRAARAGGTVCRTVRVMAVSRDGEPTRGGWMIRAGQTMVRRAAARVPGSWQGAGARRAI